MPSISETLAALGAELKTVVNTTDENIARAFYDRCVKELAPLYADKNVKSILSNLATWQSRWNGTQAKFQNAALKGQTNSIGEAIAGKTLKSLRSAEAAYKASPVSIADEIMGTIKKRLNILLGVKAIKEEATAKFKDPKTRSAFMQLAYLRIHQPEYYKKVTATIGGALAKESQNQVKLDGLSSFFKKIEDQVKDAAKSLEDHTKDAFKQLDDSLHDLVKVSDDIFAGMLKGDFGRVKNAVNTACHAVTDYFVAATGAKKLLPESVYNDMKKWEQDHRDEIKVAAAIIAIAAGAYQLAPELIGGIAQSIANGVGYVAEQATMSVNAIIDTTVSNVANTFTTEGLKNLAIKKAEAEIASAIAEKTGVPVDVLYSAASGNIQDVAIDRATKEAISAVAEKSGIPVDVLTVAIGSSSLSDAVKNAAQQKANEYIADKTGAPIAITSDGVKLPTSEQMGSFLGDKISDYVKTIGTEKVAEIVSKHLAGGAPLTSASDPRLAPIQADIIAAYDNATGRANAGTGLTQEVAAGQNASRINPAWIVAGVSVLSLLK